MAYWLPYAEKKPLKRNYTNRRRARTDGIILHVAGSESASLHGWFSNPVAYASSHLYVRRDGTIEQYIDLDLISWASNRGDARCISVETQGMGDGEWTPAQVKSLVRIISDTAKHYGYPIRSMSSSKASEKGVGWHRLGVPLNVSQKNRKISQTGGELWSSKVGKICPGPDRIKQIPSIVAQALGAKPAPVSKPAPVAKPKPGSNALAVDGWFGPATIRRLQQVLGTTVDGVISHQWAGNKKYLPRATSGWQFDKTGRGSRMIARLQSRLGVKTDGLIGPGTIKAWQRRLGVQVDGYMGPATVNAIQRKLNQGKAL